LYTKNVTVTVVVKRTERDSNITEFCLYQSSLHGMYVYKATHGL